MYLKLKNGDDIVGQYTSVNDTEDEDAHILITNPLKLVYITSPMFPDRMILSFIHWIYPKVVESTQFKIYQSDILTTGVTSAKINAHYKEFIFNTMTEEEFPTGTRLSNYTGPEEDADTLDSLEEQGRDTLESFFKKVKKGPNESMN